MKSFIQIFLFLIAGQIVSAQNWNPFVKDQNSYFKQQNDTITIVESFLMDSIKSVGKNNLLYFNTKSELSDSCSSSLRQVFNKMQYYKNPNKIDSLLLTGDSLLFISSFDAKTDTFIFKPFSKLNESWMNNGISIKCTELGIMNVFGEQDSIKTFKCSGTGFDSIEFVLSKSHGFIKFLPFNAFHFYSSMYVKQPSYFELIGYRKDGIKKGYVQPDFNDYFHLSVGDILFWRKDSISLYNQEVGWSKYHIDTIKYSYLSHDSVFYRMKRAQYNKFEILDFTNDYSVKYLRKDEGKILSSQTSWVETKFSKFQNPNIVFLESLKLKIENRDTITFSNYRFDGFFLDLPTCETVQAFDANSYSGFSTREGEIYYGDFSEDPYENTLIGSIINGVKHGITEIPTGVYPLVHQSLKVYPNPVKNYLTIDFPNHIIDHIELFDVVGNLILTEKTNGKLDLNAIILGVYILKIFDEIKTVRQIKIMKQ